MTAIVGILNKQAIAVAADSAVTIGRGQKIYNTANKVFTLSKRHPVGIAIYSNATFNDCVPWETVIKMYRDYLGDTHKSSVKEYAEDFFKFLNDFKNKHLPQQEVNKALCRDVLSFWQTVIVASVSGFNGQEELKHEHIERLDNVLKRVCENCEGASEIEMLKDITKDEFLASINTALNLISKQFEKAEAQFNEFKDRIEEILYSVFIKKTKYLHPNYTGLAFFGYGDSDIYPALFRVRVYLTKVSSIHWEAEEFNQVKEPPKDAIICPMAQSDEMLSFIAGVNPYMEEAFLNTTNETFKLFLDAIAGLVQEGNIELANKIHGVDIDTLMNSYADKIRKIKQNNMISPLVQTVSTMGKEDLAELAENLIYQTSLKRHITPNLESVGGPVDVAVISKGDGFIWIKRKHYFNPQLNQHFFDNYFEKKYYASDEF